CLFVLFLSAFSRMCSDHFQNQEPFPTRFVSGSVQKIFPAPLLPTLAGIKDTPFSYCRKLSI
ncbi:MAG: hypothetical protein AAF399_20045, partial [Bacteroidota bacterium]